MKILYFAWVREHIGMPEEEIALPAEVTTPADLLTSLRKRDPEYTNPPSNAPSSFASPPIRRISSMTLPSAMRARSLSFPR